MRLVGWRMLWAYNFTSVLACQIIQLKVFLCRLSLLYWFAAKNIVHITKHREFIVVWNTHGEKESHMSGQTTVCYTLTKETPKYAAKCNHKAFIAAALSIFCQWWSTRTQELALESVVVSHILSSYHY